MTRGAKADSLGFLIDIGLKGEISRDQLGVFIALVFAMIFIYIQHGVTLPLDMRLHGISAKYYGTLCALNGILIIFLQPLATNLSKHLSAHVAMAIAALLLGAGFGLTGFASSVPFYALSISVWTIGELVMSPVGPTIIAELAPTEHKGIYQGMYQFAWGAAMCIGPVIGSLLFGELGPSSLWLVCFIVGVFVGLFFLFQNFNK